MPHALDRIKSWVPCLRGGVRYVPQLVIILLFMCNAVLRFFSLYCFAFYLLYFVLIPGYILPHSREFSRRACPVAMAQFFSDEQLTVVVCMYA